MLDRNVEVSNLEEEIQRLLLHNEQLMKEKDEYCTEINTVRESSLHHLKQVQE